MHTDYRNRTLVSGIASLILKLARISDKRKIAESLHKLKCYKEQADGNRIFIELDHLPSKWKQEKYSLKDEFKEAREAKLKPTFKPDRKTGEYCLHVGYRIIRPKPKLYVNNNEMNGNDRGVPVSKNKLRAYYFE